MRNYFIIFSIISLIIASEPIALVTKSQGKVKFKLPSEKRFSTAMLVNQPLVDMTSIKTKSASNVKIVYLDDGTQIIIYPKTELIIKGIVENRNLIKKIELTKGAVKIILPKQENGQFQLLTPTAILSTDEGIFWAVTGKKQGVKFHGISGEAKILQSENDQSMLLMLDSTIHSMQGIDLKQEVISTFDLKEMERWELISGERILEPEKQDIIITQTELKSSEKILIFQLVNSAGFERKIQINFTKNLPVAVE